MLQRLNPRNCRPPKPRGGLLPGAWSVVDRHAEFYSRGELRSLLDAAPSAIAVGPCARLARRRRPWRRWRRARIHCATMPTGLWLARYRRPRPHKYAVVKISHGWIKPPVQRPVKSDRVGPMCQPLPSGRPVARRRQTPAKGPLAVRLICICAAPFGRTDFRSVSYIRTPPANPYHPAHPHYCPIFYDRCLPVDHASRAAPSNLQCQSYAGR